MNWGTCPLASVSATSGVLSGVVHGKTSVRMNLTWAFFCAAPLNWIVGLSASRGMATVACPPPVTVALRPAVGEVSDEHAPGKTVYVPGQSTGVVIDVCEPSVPLATRVAPAILEWPANVSVTSSPFL